MDNPNKAGELKEMMDKLKEIFEDSNSILTKTLKEIIGDIVPHNLSNPEEFIQSLINGDKNNRNNITTDGSNKEEIRVRSVKRRRHKIRFRPH